MSLSTSLLLALVPGSRLRCGLCVFALDREKPRVLLPLPLQQIAYRHLDVPGRGAARRHRLAGAALHWHKLDRHGGADAAAVLKIA